MAESSAPPVSGWHVLRRLLVHLWPAETPLRWRVGLSLVALVAAKGTTLVVPLLLGRTVDSLTGTVQTLAAPAGLVVAYGVARFGSTGLKELRDALFAPVLQRAARRVTHTTFEHLHTLELGYHLDRRTGGVSRAIERGTRAVEFLLNFVLFNILPTLAEIVLVAAILWGLFSGWYALVVLVTVAVYVVFTLAVTQWRIRIRRRLNESESEAATRAVDSLLNFETVKYFNNELHESRRFDTALAAYERDSVSSRVTLALLNAGQALIIAVGLITLLVIAARDVTTGALSVGDFTAVNGYLIQLFMPLNVLGFVYREIRRALTDLEQMYGILERPPGVADMPGAPPLVVDGGTVRFEKVSFGYDPARPVLQGVDFTVPAGHTVALVGASGAGKSTIGRLLFRFYDVTDGRITIDGQDIRRVSQDSLRAAIGIVPQDTVLFNDTIAYNIGYGRPGADPSEVEDAARLARIHDFAQSLPEGYATRVGERGLKLSGGEKQRVAIARTILKQPRLLLFDEATSALDTHTEREIQTSLQEVSRGLTTVIIAHRLSTVVHADEILVVEDGGIVERGTHGALLAAEGVYARLWQRQQEAEAAAAVLEETGVWEEFHPEKA